MSGLFSAIGRQALFSLDPEKAHGLSIGALQSGLHPRFDAARDPALAVDVAGLRFANPIGMAAGYDKGGQASAALLAMGFGHTEVGTVTPKPQSGNPKPRVFRLVEDDAVINRLGFNSEGHAVVRERLEEKGRPASGLRGINLGANKTSDDFAADYVAGIEAFAHLADYFTVNISSPNTPGLRALQGADPLADLLSRVSDARDGQTNAYGRKPLFLKIAPDLDQNELDAIAKALDGSGMDALIVSNTTLGRDGLRSRNRDETGGLSGAPLFELSTIRLAQMYQRVGKCLPLVGVGGVRDAETAWQKIEAGASLVQLYTGMIYAGPGLSASIIKGLSKRLKSDDAYSIADVTGRNAAEWAAR
ncbi:quinone-dependent dihydroorotate dehydrogenase [Ahrensia sp. R2A130]|uniref:quinone-dependent dihydroorotate dehydrogenase n=1 Tax=Ahrensia sp. R2A130 TaxID=744979 RepID=UPI0001E0CA32|nr:quinone-dependent dihydroorotate dehydrogenase [Ahrensia sp. R2A130]EFL87876.1 dihydroorotate oxidase [Ahrensia sp. R2A130]